MDHLPIPLDWILLSAARTRLRGGWLERRQIQAESKIAGENFYNDAMQLTQRVDHPPHRLFAILRGEAKLSRQVRMESAQFSPHADRNEPRSAEAMTSMTPKSLRRASHSRGPRAIRARATRYARPQSPAHLRDGIQATVAARALGHQ